MHLLRTFLFSAGEKINFGADICGNEGTREVWLCAAKTMMELHYGNLTSSKAKYIKKKKKKANPDKNNSSALIVMLDSEIRN